MEAEKLFLPAHQMAARCGLPEGWLRAEAEAGRIPSLKIGRRLHFNPLLVERSLLDRASESPSAPSEAAHA